MNIKQQLEVTHERLGLCLACESFDETTGFCAECTCDVYGKVRLLGSGCPLEKWQAVDWNGEG
jgi:hypothetical protein